MLFFNWTPLAPGLASFCLFSVFSAHIILKQINVKNHLEFELTTSCKSFSSNNNRPPIISMEIYLRKVKTKRRFFSELNNLKIVLEKFTILTLNHWDFWPLGTVWLDGQIIFQYLATCNNGKLPNRIKNCQIEFNNFAQCAKLKFPNIRFFRIYEQGFGGRSNLLQRDSTRQHLVHKGIYISFGHSIQGPIK